MTPLAAEIALHAANDCLQSRAVLAGLVRQIKIWFPAASATEVASGLALAARMVSADISAGQSAISPIPLTNMETRV